MSLPPDMRRDTEIVISDNHSTDGTSALLASAFANEPIVKVFSPPRHLPTAEENLCYAVTQCAGDYVWTLGDDDSVDPHALLTLRDCLHEGKFDLIIFNSRATSYFGMPLRMIRIPCFSERLETDLLTFIKLTGFWFVIAGFSTTVFRRTHADIAEFEKILSRGKIYSHVIWLIACFAKKPFVFINRPLVNYRQNLSDVTDTGHWERVAERERASVGAIWSTGFIKLLEYLVKKAIITPSFLRDVLDRNLVSRFYFADEMLAHFNRGLKHDLQTARSTVTLEDIELFRTWAIDIWADDVLILSLLDEVRGCIVAGRPVRAGAIENLGYIIDSRNAQPWCERFHRYDISGYSVYNHAEKWFAIRADSYDKAKYHLEYLDFRSDPPYLLVRLHERELIESLEKLDVMMPSNFVRENELRLACDAYRDRLLSGDMRNQNKSSPSVFKRILIAVWDGLPRGIQTAIEPIADRIDRMVD